MVQKYKFLLKGIPASPGIAIGRAYLLTGGVIKIEERNISDADIELEVEKLKNAIEKAKEDIIQLRERATKKLGMENGKIFDVHQMLLEDYIIIDQIIEAIRSEKKNAELVFFRYMNHYQSKLEQLNDEYLKERSADIVDVKRRVIRHLQGKRHDYLAALSEPRVIIARDLTPSDTLALDRRKILAFATDFGGRTSHAAIMARALEIPSVLGLEHITDVVLQNSLVIVDGNNGQVLLEPSADTLEKYRGLQREYDNYEEKLSYFKELPCRTLDGKDIELSANLELPDEIGSVLSHGAKGIGLYRTEFLYLAKDQLPSEEEQFSAYKIVAEKIAPNSVIIRTADLGGDKSPNSLEMPHEDNPFLGWRAIRICLKETEMFRTQLRAILRASVTGNIKIMFPMISCIEELNQCLELLEESKQELREKGIPFNDEIEVGTMIEVPSAAIMTSMIAAKVNFLSIGTNDLIQYTLAADRSNERIAYLYENFPPAIIRLVKQVVDAGHRRGVWVGMCGEMAGDPKAIILLIGLGLDELSVSPVAIPKIKQIIRSINYSEATQIAQRVLQMETSVEIQKYIEKVMEKKFHDFPFLI